MFTKMAADDREDEKLEEVPKGVLVHRRGSALEVTVHKRATETELLALDRKIKKLVGRDKKKTKTEKRAWSRVRRFPISAGSYDKVQKFVKLRGTLKPEDLPGREFRWAHAGPIKLGKSAHGKIVLLALEKDDWKVIVPKERIENFCRDAILTPASKVPLTRDAGYHILQKGCVGISRRAFYAFLAKQKPLQLTRNQNSVMRKPGRPLEARGSLELDLVEAKGKDIGKFLHHYVKNFYFITLIDRLTGWFEVGRALHKDALTISKKLKVMLKRMGRALGVPPDKFYIRSDSGSEFKAETQVVFKELKVRHKFVSSGNRIEKVNQDFQRTWYRLMRLGRGDLEELDQQAAAITNNLKSKVTGYTPLEALDIEDATLSSEFNKHRTEMVKYKAPTIKIGDKVRHAVPKEVGKHGKALAYKAYRGKHWSAEVYVVVKINTGGTGTPLTRYYVAGKWRFRDQLLAVPGTDPTTEAVVRQRLHI